MGNEANQFSTFFGVFFEHPTSALKQHDISTYFGVLFHPIDFPLFLEYFSFARGTGKWEMKLINFPLFLEYFSFACGTGIGGNGSNQKNIRQNICVVGAKRRPQ